MIDILGLTTSDAVRAVLGVDVEELEDEVFTSIGVNEELQLDLDGWLPAGADLETITADGSTADRGTDEYTTYQRLAAYSRAFCSHYLLIGQNNWRLTRLTDGTVNEQRSDFSKDEEMERRLLDLMNKHKQALLDLLEGDSGVVSFGVAGVSSPSYDPVTG